MCEATGPAASTTAQASLAQTQDIGVTVTKGIALWYDMSSAWFLGAKPSQACESMSAVCHCSGFVSAFAAHRSRWPAIAANESNEFGRVCRAITSENAEFNSLDHSLANSLEHSLEHVLCAYGGRRAVSRRVVRPST